MILRLLGLFLPIWVFGLAIVAATSFVLAFFGLPIGWAAMSAVQSLGYMRFGYGLITNGDGGLLDNGAGALSAIPLTALVFFGKFVFSDWPRAHTAWWSLLMIPGSIIVPFAVMAAVEFILNAVNPSGRKPPIRAST